jgi:hypothetical protein
MWRYNVLDARAGATGSSTISASAGGYNFFNFNHSATLYVDPLGHPHVLIPGRQSVNIAALESGVWYMQWRSPRAIALCHRALSFRGCP